MDNENINENQTGGKYSSRIISIIGWVIHLVVALVAGYLAYYANANRNNLFQKIVPIVFAIIYSYVYIIWHIIKYYILGQHMYSKGPLINTVMNDVNKVEEIELQEIIKPKLYIEANPKGDPAASELAANPNSEGASEVTTTHEVKATS